VTVKRIALLGATGSIGRQAIEVVERNPELELCALASGHVRPDGAGARSMASRTAQVGGDVTELLDAARPDVVLNAIVGFAGVGATLWALERGVTLALANKESLVAAGDSRSRRESGAGACCSRSTPSTPRSSSASKAASRPRSTRSC
jgi:1-deoxy-D-xylulose-5-phosphate reductoisomerase